MSGPSTGHSEVMWWAVLVAMWLLGSFPAAAAVGRAIAFGDRSRPRIPATVR